MSRNRLDTKADQNYPKKFCRCGCMGKGTNILIEDGSQRRIEDIRIGERIWNGFKVANIWTGMEDTLVYIKTAVGELYLTKDHPVCTENGWKRAEDLTTDDKIYTLDRSEKILELSEKPWQDKVYNLDLENERERGYVLAQGLKTGDMQLQNALYDYIKKNNWNKIQY